MDKNENECILKRFQLVAQSEPTCNTFAPLGWLYLSLPWFRSIWSVWKHRGLLHLHFLETQFSVRKVISRNALCCLTQASACTVMLCRYMTNATSSKRAYNFSKLWHSSPCWALQTDASSSFLWGLISSPMPMQQQLHAAWAPVLIANTS